MNIDTIAGTTDQVKGQVKEGLGQATNDPVLQQDGLADQLTGTVRKGIGQVRDVAMKQPFATAAAVGVIGLAIINTLRGKKTY